MRLYLGYIENTVDIMLVVHTSARVRRHLLTRRLLPARLLPADYYPRHLLPVTFTTRNIYYPGRILPGHLLPTI